MSGSCENTKEQAVETPEDDQKQEQEQEEREPPRLSKFKNDIFKLKLEEGDIWRVP